MSTLLAAAVTAPVTAIGVAQLQAWLEKWDHQRHAND